MSQKNRGENAGGIKMPHDYCTGQIQEGNCIAKAVKKLKIHLPLLAMLVILLALLTLFSGCISELLSKKVSNENFEFGYLETTEWERIPLDNYYVSTFLEEFDENVSWVLILGNERKMYPAAIIVLCEETEPDNEKDLNIFLIGTQALLRLEGTNAEDAGLFYNKNNQQWASFKISDENETDIFAFTYCGPWLVKAILFTSEKTVSSDKIELMGIIDSFHCKVPTNFKEETQ